MAFILRTWGCQNSNCRKVFTAGDANPACPRCGCVRVGWVPAQVNVGSGATKVADGDLRTLAERFGLTDLNSAEAGRGAKKVRLPAPGGGAGVVNFGGFAATIDPASSRTPTNQSGAQCVPTANRIDAKVRAGMDQKMTGQLGLAPISANTQIVQGER